MAELVVRNAIIADGTGGPLRHGDVAVSDGVIVSAGDEAVTAAGPGTTELDGRGELVCAPGFIDVHTHDDAAVVRHPGLEFKVAQGCTSLVIGNCGFSAFPAIGEDDIESIAGSDWTDLDAYRRDVTASGFAANVMALVGHNTIRIVTIGREVDRPATAAELAVMRGHVRRAMEQGACGLSTGLIYTPGKWTSTEEIIELARAAAEAGGLYATHMRNEGERLLESVDEALAIGRKSGCPVHISHHKAGGQENWGKVALSLAEIDRANAASPASAAGPAGATGPPSAAGPTGAAGPAVTLDFYPYTASSGPMFEYTSPETITPDWAEHNQFATCPPFPRYQGRRVAEVADAEGLSLSELVRRVFATAEGRQTISIGFGMSPDDLATNIRHPLMMIGSDGIPDLNGLPHPRLFGTFPRIYAEYVRRLGLITMVEAVRRMTSLPADRFGLTGRGRLEPGAAGDLVVFDPTVISDVATYEDPKREPVGIAWVVINGQLTYDHGRHTGARAGRVLSFGVS